MRQFTIAGCNAKFGEQAQLDRVGLRGLPWLPIGGALVSLLAIIPWWNTVMPGAKAGGLFDLITVIALLPPWREQVMAYLGL